MGLRGLFYGDLYLFTFSRKLQEFSSYDAQNARKRNQAVTILHLPQTYAASSNEIPLGQGSTNFPKSRNHFNILGARRVTRSKFRPGYPQLRESHWSMHVFVRNEQNSSNCATIWN